MMAESGMPANPYQYWTLSRAYDVLAVLNEKDEWHGRKLAQPDGDDL
jgi:hypothetical protein